MKEFIEANRFLKERVDMGIDIYPSDLELQTFKEIAEGYEPSLVWTLKGCQDCVKELIRFVYTRFDKELVTVFTLPDDVIEPKKKKK